MAVRPERPRGFIILSTRGGGGRRLARALDKSAGLTCYRGVYATRAVDLPRKQLAELGLRREETGTRTARDIAFFDALCALTREKLTGFEAAPRHVHALPPGLRDMLYGGQIRVVAARRPALEVTISCARDSQLAHDGPAMIPPALLSQIVARCDALSETVARLRRAPRVWLAEVPGALSGDPDTIRALAGRLRDPSSQPPDPGTVPLRRLHRQIANWPEIFEILTRNDRADLLAEAGYAPDGLAASG